MLLQPVQLSFLRTLHQSVPSTAGQPPGRSTVRIQRLENKEGVQGRYHFQHPSLQAFTQLRPKVGPGDTSSPPNSYTLVYKKRLVINPLLAKPLRASRGPRPKSPSRTLPSGRRLAGSGSICLLTASFPSAGHVCCPWDTELSPRLTQRRRQEGLLSPRLPAKEQELVSSLQPRPYNCCHGSIGGRAGPAFEGRDLSFCTQQALDQHCKLQTSSRAQAAAQGGLPALSRVPQAPDAENPPPQPPAGEPPPLPNLEHRPLGPGPGKSPLATAAGPASLGRDDWLNSGRRRCRHFRHPEAAKETEGGHLGSVRLQGAGSGGVGGQRAEAEAEAEAESEPKGEELSGAGAASAAPSMVGARILRRPVLHSASLTASSWSSGAVGGAAWRLRR